MNNQHISHQQAGFSLLEMLLAFSLVALLFLALFTSFNTVARSWESAEKRMKKTEDRQLISTFLQTQLQQILVLKLKPTSENPSLYSFGGAKDRLRFTAPLQPLYNKGGIYFIELFIYPTQNNHQDKQQYNTLAMRYAPYRPDSTWEAAFETAATIDIYQNFHSVSFAYLQLETAESATQWLEQWQDPHHYPRLLKLHLEAPKSEPWADIIIELPQIDDYSSTQHVPSKARNRSRNNHR